MQIITITSGEKYIDIDAFACAFAYRELLLSEGKNVEVVLPGPANNNVTDFCKNLAGNFFVIQPIVSPKHVVLVDISEPEFTPSFVVSEKVVEVYDHHFGFESLWKEKIATKAKIEPVGACATLIWEEFRKRNNGKISHASATLLMLAIISNTLNFRAGITKDRDHTAFRELDARFSIPPRDREKFFSRSRKSSLSKHPGSSQGRYQNTTHSES